MNRKSLIAMILIMVSLVLASCASTGDISKSEDVEVLSVNDVLELYNSMEGTVFMGVSGRYTDDDKAIVQAVSNLARNIALNNAIDIRIDSDIRTFTRADYDRFKQEAIAVFDSTQIQTIADNMEIIDISRADLDTGVYALAYWNGSDKKPVHFDRSVNSEGRPKWVDEVPVIEGYRTAVGKTLEYQYLQDSLEAAAFQGATLIAGLRSDLSVSAEALTVRNSDFGSSIDRSVYEINLSKVMGFKVLSYWYDEKTREFYALVAVEE